MKKISSRVPLPSPSMLVAILALVVACAGGAYAAAGGTGSL
jgi:hypothetical protein